MEYYGSGIKEVLKELNTTENGLSNEEAKNRLEKYGLNRLKEEKGLSPFKIFFNQFKSFLIIILILAAIISFFIGEVADSLVILVIVVLNALIGFFQEYKAEKTIEALKKLEALKTTVIRDGKEQVILAEGLVIGDIIKIEAGDKIPADCRIIYSNNVNVDEAALTGESVPASKVDKTVNTKNIADQKNMLFSGTLVTRGIGRAVVVRTAMDTEIGKIATLVQETKTEKTPLQKKLDGLAKFLGIAILVIIAIVFSVGLILGIGLLEMFLASVSLAVAAIPEGLPAVITVSLALGVRRMMRKNALIRKLSAVETLGATTVICADKTGTLTKNEMTVKEIFSDNKLIGVSGEGYSKEGKFSYNGQGYDSRKLNQLLSIAANCNDANLENLTGDPTELALLVVAEKGVYSKEKRINEIPFESETKFMATFHEGNKVYFKGAVEVILNKCKYILIEGRLRLLTGQEKEKISKENEKMANNALRVLGFAYSDRGKENELIFVGLMGMIDPPREEVKLALKECDDAGIKVVMITGDHKLTALAIGRELGFKGNCLTGEELDKIEDGELGKYDIYARVNPEHKVKILDYYKRHENIVAMTGDGVNDAPALKKADIGIAMGIKGTEVSKEASSMILLDDNFETIVNSVKEGRGIYDNIKKFVGYLVSSNLGEVLVVFLAIVFNWGLPLTAIQILWMNLVTDGLPALALSEEPMENDIMQRKPRRLDEKVIDKSGFLHLLLLAVVIMVGTLFVFRYYGQTMAFTTLVMFQLFNVLNFKSNKSILSRAFNNKYLILAIISSVILQLVILYTPLNSVFGVEPLSLLQWGIILIVSFSILFFEEFRKFLVNRSLV